MERSLIKQVNKKNMAARLNTRRGEKKNLVEVGDSDRRERRSGNGRRDLFRRFRTAEDP